MSMPTAKTFPTEVTTCSFSGVMTTPNCVSTNYMVVRSSNTAPVDATASGVTYAFMSSAEQYEKIFSAQCSRIGSVINDRLQNLDRADDDYNESIIDYIARIIDLVGEPAFLTAAVEARCAEDNAAMLEPLLLAIASAKHKESEGMRLDAIKNFAERSDFRTQRAAVRALSRFNSPNSKALLKQIGANYNQSEIGKMATALAK